MLQVQVGAGQIWSWCVLCFGRLPFHDPRQRRVERTSSRAGVSPAGVQRLSRRTLSPTICQKDERGASGAHAGLCISSKERCGHRIWIVTSKHRNRCKTERDQQCGALTHGSSRSATPFGAARARNLGVRPTKSGRASWPRKFSWFLVRALSLRSESSTSSIRSGGQSSRPVTPRCKSV